MIRRSQMLATLTAGLASAAGPALAAGDSFFSLSNTDFIVTLGFIVFIAILVYFKVPGLLGGMLDKRAEGIRADLDEARSLREEAQKLLASYERKQQDMQEQANRIVDAARKEARAAAEQAKADLAVSLERRMQSAGEQIAQAEAKAVKQVRDSAVNVAIAAASEVLRGQMDADKAAGLIDGSIDEVGKRLH